MKSDLIPLNSYDTSSNTKFVACVSLPVSSEHSHEGSSLECGSSSNTSPVLLSDLMLYSEHYRKVICRNGVTSNIVITRLFGNLMLQMV